MESHPVSPRCRVYFYFCFYSFLSLFCPRFLYRVTFSLTPSLLTFQRNFCHHFWLVSSNSLFEARRTRNTFNWWAISREPLNNMRGQRDGDRRKWTKVQCIFLLLLLYLFKKAFQARDVAQWQNTCLAYMKPWVWSLGAPSQKLCTGAQILWHRWEPLG